MNQKRNKFVQQWLNALLALVVVALVAWLTFHFKTEFDWTYGGRNTLSPASQKLLKALPDPIHFYGFVYSQEANQREAIRQGVARYQRFKSNVTLTFYDPSLDPQEVKKYDVTQPGELVVEYDGQHETLDKVSEPEVSNALERLATKNTAYVAFLTGHGERAINDKTRNGYSSFAQALRNKGLTVVQLDLTTQPQVPYNVSALVIADPASALLPGERKLIEKYVDFGGNLLWLADTEQPPRMEVLAKQLGITWQNGYVVFPNYRELGTGNPGIYLASSYPTNPVTKNLREITVFPFVRSLNIDRTSGWHQYPMLETDQAAWLESDPKENPVTFDPKTGDIAGPLTIGLAEKREVKVPESYTRAAEAAMKKGKAEFEAYMKSKNQDGPATAGSAATPAAAASVAAKPQTGDKAKTATTDKKADDDENYTIKTQRVVLVGDADFLANGNIKLLGNESLGTDIITWLTNRNVSLGITIPKAPDRNLYLPGWATWLITAGYVVVLPLLLIAFGLLRWAVRRRR